MGRKIKISERGTGHKVWCCCVVLCVPAFTLWVHFVSGNPFYLIYYFITLCVLGPPCMNFGFGFW